MRDKGERAKPGTPLTSIGQIPQTLKPGRPRGPADSWDLSGTRTLTACGSGVPRRLPTWATPV